MRKGSKMTEEQKRKISIANKGKIPYVMTDEIRKKMSLNRDVRFGSKHPMWKGGVSKNKEYKRIRNKEWHKKNKEHVKEKKKQAWTKFVKEREKMVGRPKPNKCEICGSPKRICYDHDHKTGKFRGWICHSCNVALGAVKDKIKILFKMIKYLKKTLVSNGEGKILGKL